MVSSRAIQYCNIMIMTQNLLQHFLNANIYLLPWALHCFSAFRHGNFSIKRQGRFKRKPLASAISRHRLITSFKAISIHTVTYRSWTLYCYEHTVFFTVSLFYKKKRKIWKNNFHARKCHTVSHHLHLAIFLERNQRGSL